jgi:Co/Zn/Cd efflux system component
MTSANETLRYRVIGMDCAHDAREIEDAARASGAVQNVRVSVSSQILTLQLSPTGAVTDVTDAVNGIGYQLSPLTPTTADAISGSETHKSTAYRNALWIVIILNTGYGLIEMMGGFLSGSQALKSDALDFMGDGLTTLLGVIAIGWGLAWRARSALIQGVFIGLIGIGVLVNTVMRWADGYVPEAQLMGIFGIIALAVNVASTVVLLPHRAGDSNVKAVWMFSRNDAIGNVAVIISAILVSWLGTAWPDLLVALVIASLFLHSAWVIIRDARTDLAEATAPSTVTEL